MQTPTEQPPSPTPEAPPARRLRAKPRTEDRGSMSFPVGTTHDGRKITGDFGQVPHILVGGSTGSGKSNFLHALIRWLVQSHSPDELKLVLSDAKRVEFVDYAELPHLLCRIAHETDEFIAAFRKLERKLERRLESYACTNCADIDEWNRRGNWGFHAHIVAVIDEFADYMCAEGAIVEPLVRRLATDGARAGIHLVIATSRFGSDEIFTDGILAAVPGRMAFRSIDSDDSKRFLGAAGAECLAGQGDGFWRSAGGKPLRLQTPPVREENVENPVVEAFRLGFDEQPDSRDRRRNPGEQEPCPQVEPDSGELYCRALDVVRATGRASISTLQRRLGIGYKEALRAISLLEMRGIVGPQCGKGPREIRI